MSAYNQIIKDYCPDYKNIGYNLNNEKEIAGFFEPNKVKPYTFQNKQVFELEELIGRARSTSYFPKENSKSYEIAIKQIEELFYTYQKSNNVHFLYNTFMYVSRI